MTQSIHSIRLRRLWGKVHTTLYSDTALNNPADSSYHARIEQLRTELENWRVAIPAMPPIQGEALSLFATPDWFQLNYNYTILQLYRIQITDSKGGAADNLFFECLHAAENICHGYRRQFLGKPTTYTWGALHELFLSGLTYLHCLWMSPAVREVTRQDQASSTCTDCTIVLVIIAERWEAAAPYRDIFETLASRTMTMMADKKHQEWILPGTSTDALDQSPGELTQWMASIADTGMSDGYDRLLTGLVGDLPRQPQFSSDRAPWDDSNPS